jgi:hypothetical protein
MGRVREDFAFGHCGGVLDDGSGWVEVVVWVSCRLAVEFVKSRARSLMMVERRKRGCGKWLQKVTATPRGWTNSRVR